MGEATYSIIIFCSFFVSKKSNIAAAPARKTKNIKKSYKLCIWYPKKLVVLPPSGYSELNTPASLFPKAFAVNQIAISNEENLSGDNLFTSDIPMGDRHNSPAVCRAYMPVSHIMLTLIPGETLLTPLAIHK